MSNCVRSCALGLPVDAAVSPQLAAVEIVGRETHEGGDLRAAHAANTTGSIRATRWLRPAPRIEYPGT